jgi:beta-phosphoglucomutase-like phosphatase (HAD superfamily)
MVLEAMAAHGFAPNDTCFVGDTATDMQAAFRAGAGVTRVLVGTGYGEPVYEALLRVSARENAETARRERKRFVVDVPEADPTDSIPRETLPVTVCANVEEAADMLLETRVVEVEL